MDDASLYQTLHKLAEPNCDLCRWGSHENRYWPSPYMYANGWSGWGHYTEDGKWYAGR